MSAEQQANSNIEIGVISRERELCPVLDRIARPTRYVVASGNDRDRELCRPSADAAAAGNANIRVSAKVLSSHDSILRKDSPAVVAAIRDVAALGREQV
jgi:hypothetical protein